MMKRAISYIAGLQGIYYFLTGLWPIIDIHSFMAVTGPKNDIWLVKTVGVVIVAIGATLITAQWKKEITISTLVLAISSAAGLAAIDIYYSLNDVISDIYLLDAVAEGIIILIWIVYIRKIYAQQSRG